MDGRQGEYSHSGLSSPYQQQQLYVGAQHSEDSADATSASHYTPGPDVKFNPSATPTSEYGMHPTSARSPQYPEYMQRPQFPDGAQRYHPNAAAHATQPAGSGQMLQSTSPSTPIPDGDPQEDNADASELSSNTDVPVDPSIAVAPPTYPHHYNPYPSQHEAPHYPPQQHMYHPPQYGGTAYHGPAAGMQPAYGHIPPPMTQPQAMAPPGTRPPGVGCTNRNEAQN